MRAIWNGVTIAESDQTVELEGNHYFPLESLAKEYFRDSPATTVCPWKGVANYYDVVVNGATNERAAWTYRTPSGAADYIKDYVAFWRGVEVKA